MSSTQTTTSGSSSNGSRPPSSAGRGGGGVAGVDTSPSSCVSSSTLPGIQIVAATLASSRSAVSSPNSPTLS